MLDYLRQNVMNYWQISIALDILESHQAHLAKNICNFRLFEIKCHALTTS